MIQMSRAASLWARTSRPIGRFDRASIVAAAAALVLAFTLTGCCGGGPSHKCDFTPYNAPHDAAPDGPIPCGTQICSDTQVCCVTIAPPLANCIDQDPVKFMQLGCKKPADVSCIDPSSCPGGFVCCFTNTQAMQSLSCAAPQLCSSNGQQILCSSDADCPGQASGSCQQIASTTTGAPISACH
jgi:hypothetical protein